MVWPSEIDSRRIGFCFFSLPGQVPFGPGAVQTGTMIAGNLAFYVKKLKTMSAFAFVWYQPILRELWSEENMTRDEAVVWNNFFRHFCDGFAMRK